MAMAAKRDARATDQGKSATAYPSVATGGVRNTVGQGHALSRDISPVAASLRAGAPLLGGEPQDLHIGITSFKRSVSYQDLLSAQQNNGAGEQACTAGYDLVSAGVTPLLQPVTSVSPWLLAGELFRQDATEERDHLIQRGLVLSCTGVPTSPNLVVPQYLPDWSRSGSSVWAFVEQHLLSGQAAPAPTPFALGKAQCFAMAVQSYSAALQQQPTSTLNSSSSLVFAAPVGLRSHLPCLRTAASSPIPPALKWQPSHCDAGLTPTHPPLQRHQQPGGALGGTPPPDAGAPVDHAQPIANGEQLLPPRLTSPAHGDAAALVMRQPSSFAGGGGSSSIVKRVAYAVADGIAGPGATPAARRLMRARVRAAVAGGSILWFLISLRSLADMDFQHDQLGSIKSLLDVLLNAPSLSEAAQDLARIGMGLGLSMMSQRRPRSSSSSRGGGGRNDTE